eukprot:scaffold304992_cov30-Tisochrysis_lutea.AAC.5
MKLPAPRAQAMARSNAGPTSSNASKYTSKNRPRTTALADATNGVSVVGGANGGVVVVSEEFETRLAKMEASIKEVRFNTAPASRSSTCASWSPKVSPLGPACALVACLFSTP